MEHGQGGALSCGPIHECSRRRGVNRERLVHHDGQPGVEDALGVLDVLPARRRDDDEVEVWHREERVKVGHGQGIGQVGGDLGDPIGVSRRHRDDGQPGGTQ